MAYIDWKPVRDRLAQALPRVGELKSFGTELAKELARDGEAYERAGSFTTSSRIVDTVASAPIPPARLAIADKITLVIGGLFNVTTSGGTAPFEQQPVANRTTFLRARSDIMSDPFWSRVVAEAERLLTPPTITTSTTVVTVTGDSGAAETSALQIAVANATAFMGIVS